MTYNKMLKEIRQLAIQFGEDFEIIWVIDTWGISYTGDMGIKRTNDLREVITIADLYGQFVYKSGDFYDKYKFTDKFRELVKLINGKPFKPIQVPKNYQDSQDKFLEEWNKIHPEISYAEYLKKEAEKNHRRFGYMNALFDGPYSAYSDTYLIQNYCS